MAEQRRRGRGGGRTGRGGRIPKKGDNAGGFAAADEEYVSFPLEVTAPLKIASAVDAAAVERALSAALEQERSQAANLALLAQRWTEPVVGEIRTQIERHREMLEQLARDLGAETGGEAAAEHGAAPSPADFAAEQLRARLAWMTLQSAAYASGDHRIDRVVKDVLKEKQRHSELVTALAVRDATQQLMREPE